MEYPGWFYYAVDDFYAKTISEINKRLQERIVDANSVISITEEHKKGEIMYHVLYKMKVFD